MMQFFRIVLVMGHLLTPWCLQYSGIYKTPNVGDQITLQCNITEETVMLYWFKQTLGQKPNLISTLYKYDNKGLFYNEFKDNPRFDLSPNNNLTISDLQVSDSATYYCACSQTYVVFFAEGYNVIVKSLDLNIEAEVRQLLPEKNEPGDTITLNCTVHTGSCEGEHRVYWFKKTEDGGAGVLYSHGGSRDQCERNTDNYNTTSNSCVFNLPIHNVSSEQTGTYYCAVASCGHLLFGNGTKLDVDVFASSAQVYVLSAALGFTSVLVVLLAVIICILNKRNNTEPYLKSSVSSKTNAKVFKKGDVLRYVAMDQKKTNRSRTHRDDTWSECVYFNIQ